MAKQFYSLLTTYGEQVLAQAVANRRPLYISQMAVGDGNGKATVPTSQRNSLVREVHRANISAVSLDPRNNKQVIFELTIPENVGGFYIREMGIFDDQHKLVAYANCPESFKPTLESGSGKVQVLRMILKVSSSDAVTLSVDHSVIFVTKAQFTPQTLTATTQNAVSEQGHSHEIAKGNTSQAGLVRLTNNTWLDSEELGLSAKGAKELAQGISQNRINANTALATKVDKTAVSDAVNSDSKTNVANSKAVKTAYDKAVDGVNRANNAQNTANSATQLAHQAQQTANDGVNRANQAQNTANDAVKRANTAQNTANNAQTKANQADNNANGRVSKSGDRMTGDLEIKSSQWSSIKLFNNDNHYLRIEVSPNSDANFGALLHHDGKNILHRLLLPKKTGTLATVEELDNKFIGAVVFFAMASPPIGWLKANGAAVSRTTYAALFAAIGTTFGAGDGRTTFNLPDLRGEFLRGLDDGRNIDGGRRLGSYQADEIKSHTINVPNSQWNGNVVGSWFYAERGNGNNNQDSNTITYNGGRETRPRNIALLACIKY